eukprot:TRINITY_DN5764_c0_g5_i1.p1 TRINITY_DN5764_c0_g5~~TRINITY_DN5764_c0_g5_i1.p1  ORF type:complete len:337 (+),score=92.24 TRINITY_DN5764_c0_g5_i1:100-1110(+)
MSTTTSDSMDSSTEEEIVVRRDSRARPPQKTKHAKQISSSSSTAEEVPMESHRIVNEPNSPSDSNSESSSSNTKRKDKNPNKKIGRNDFQISVEKSESIEESTDEEAKMHVWMENCVIFVQALWRGFLGREEYDERNKTRYLDRMKLPVSQPLNLVNKPKGPPRRPPKNGKPPQVKTLDKPTEREPIVRPDIDQSENLNPPGRPIESGDARPSPGASKIRIPGPLAGFDPAKARANLKANPVPPKEDRPPPDAGPKFPDVKLRNVDPRSPLKEPVDSSNPGYNKPPPPLPKGPKGKKDDPSDDVTANSTEPLPEVSGSEPPKDGAPKKKKRRCSIM